MTEPTSLFISLTEKSIIEKTNPLKSLLANCEILTGQGLDEGVRTAIAQYYDPDVFPQNPSKDQLQDFKNASSDFVSIANKIYDQLNPELQELLNETIQGLLIYNTTQKNKYRYDIANLRDNLN